MNRKLIIEHITNSVSKDKELINQIYKAADKPNATKKAMSVRKSAILKGDYFGENFIFVIELINKCGLSVVEKI